MKNEKVKNKRQKNKKTKKDKKVKKTESIKNKNKYRFCTVVAEEL